MPESGLRFASKLDRWMLLLILPGLSLGPIIIILTSRSGGQWIVPFIAVFGADLIIVMMIAWMITTTAYYIGETSLVIRCGPIRREVPFATIRRIRKSHSVESAIALSLDRIELLVENGRPVIISPEPRGEFLEALRTRAREVIIEAM